MLNFTAAFTGVRVLLVLNSEIVLVCNEDVKPLRLQRIKHLPLQYMLNFYPNLLFFMPVSS